MRARNGKKPKWICRAIVESPYHIGLCINEASYLTELKRLKVPLKNQEPWIPSNANACVHFFEQKKTKSLLALVCIENRKNKDPNGTVGLLIHEAVHIWQHIAEEIRETKPSDEFEAYSIQAIAQRLIAAYSEARRG